MNSTKLVLSSTPVNLSSSFQTFLSLNNLQGKFDWNNYEHTKLLREWREQQETFVPFAFMGISPSNDGFNH